MCTQQGLPIVYRLQIAAGGNALNTRKIRIKMFNNLLATITCNYFDTLKRSFDNLPLSYLQSPDFVPVSVADSSVNPFDRIVVANIAFTYPATFNFNGLRIFTLNCSQQLQEITWKLKILIMVHLFPYCIA